MSELEQCLEVALRLARDAGEALRQRYTEPVTIAHKGDIDLVTDADKAAEEILLAGLSREFPQHSILAEESGQAQSGQGKRWIVDPLDGTVNFAHKIPHFCVLVALQDEATEGIELGVTYEPLRDEMFAASTHQPTTLNGEPITVSQTPDLIQSVLATGFGYNRLFEQDDNHAEFCRLNLLTQGVRRFGSAGLDLAYVAAGRLDGFWESRLNPWDLAAGLLLVRKAGGVVTSLDASAPRLDGSCIVASNGHIHNVLGAAVRSAHDAPCNSREGLTRFLPPDTAHKLDTLA